MTPELMDALQALDGIVVTQAIAPWVIPAITALAGMMRGGGSSGGSGTGGSQQMSPDMLEMLEMQRNRMRAQEPLYANVMAMAQRMLPKWARGNGGMPPGGGGAPNPGGGGTPLPNAYTPGHPKFDPTNPDRPNTTPEY